MKVIKETSRRATRKSSQKVMTGAMPYLTRVMEVIVVVARRLSEQVKVRIRIVWSIY